MDYNSAAAAMRAIIERARKDPASAPDALPEMIVQPLDPEPSSAAADVGHPAPLALAASIPVSHSGPPGTQQTPT